MNPVICDYCCQQATRYADGSPLCVRCARVHYESEWRIMTRDLGVRARAELADRAKQGSV